MSASPSAPPPERLGSSAAADREPTSVAAVAAEQGEPGHGRGGGQDPRPELAGPAWDRRDRRFVAALVLAALVVYLATATYGVIQANDSRSAAVAAWSLTHQGSLALPDSFDTSARWWAVEGADGNVYSNRFPGVIAWGVPFYGLQRLVTGPVDAPHPYLLDYRPAGVAAATVTALAVGAAYAVGRQLAGRRTALGFALVLGFTTPWWSVSANVLWPHGITSLCLLLTVLALARPSPSPPLVLAGVAGSLLTRPHLIAAQGVLGVWLLLRRRWGSAAWFALAGCVGVGLLVAYSWQVFGTMLPVAGYDTEAVTSTLLASDPVETLRGIGLALVSTQRGVLLFTPVVLVLLPLSVAGWRASPGWARASAIAGIAYLLLQFRAIRWSGGEGFFAYRTPIEGLVLLAPLWLRAWQAAIRPVPWRRWLVIAALVVSFAIHAYGAVTSTTRPETLANWDRVLDDLEDEHGRRPPRL